MPEPRSWRLLLLGAFLLFASTGAASDWPQWRGGAQAGSSIGSSLDGAETVGFDLLWRRSLGSGYSSVSIVGDLGVTMATMGAEDWVVAFDADSGAVRWRFPLGEAFLGRSGSDDGPMSTPAIGGGYVYALSGDGRFVALEVSSGHLAWEYRLGDVFGSTPDYYGFSTAPIVVDDRVYLLAGGGEAPMLVAFDRATGAPLWKAGTETVQHQNLLVTRLGGIEQVVAPGRASVSGFATQDGRLLWSYEFEEATEAGAAVTIDRGRVLVTRWSSAHLLEVTPDGDLLQAREAWKSEMLGSSYAVPVLHGDHLYGFNRHFLSCVNLESGELLWRSRPPGGHGLIAVDDHLLVMADDGSLVAVEATPDGYRESGRLELFERRRVLTPPSFAGGRVFVRNLNEIVALDVRPAASAPEHRASAPQPKDKGALGSLLTRLVSESESKRNAALAELERDYRTTPVLEDGAVHFLYRGDEPDLAIVGDMTGAHDEMPMRRLGRSEWHHRSFQAPESGRWEYQFKIYEEARLDPMNSAVVLTPDGERSVVAFGDSDGAARPPLCADCPRGAVSSHEIQSQVPERSYKLSVYRPPGYETEEGGTLPMVIWAQGEMAQEFGEAVAWLDGLIGNAEIRPVLGVFLELPDSSWWDQSRARLEEVLAQDLMPFLESHYRLREHRRDDALILQGWSASSMLIWGLENGVGKISLQSPFFGEHYLARELSPRLTGGIETRLYVDWGSHDQVNPDWGLDVATQSRHLADLFRTAGSEVAALETPGGANWTRWSSQTGRILRSFFPAH